MAEHDQGAERKRNIWAPWRMKYIESLGEKGDGCFLCHHRDHAEQDTENLILCRRTRTFAMLNRFPYTGGHSMVAPLEHVGDLSALDGETMRQMMELLRDLQQILTHALHAEGFNVGFNIGRCAGAGLPGHLHAHIVPRWSGDTNFMPVFGEVHVIPQSLEDLYGRIKRAGEELGLPKP